MCIDQGNVSERNHQVTLMSRIYSQAQRVAIYLGEPENDSDTAIAFLIDNDSPAGEISYAKTNQLLHSLNCFFNRSWFTRVWVIQEVLLSLDAVAYCGDKTSACGVIKTFYQWNVSERWLARLPYVVATSQRRPDSHVKTTRGTARPQTPVTRCTPCFRTKGCTTWGLPPC